MSKDVQNVSAIKSTTDPQKHHYNQSTQRLKLCHSKLSPQISSLNCHCHRVMTPFSPLPTMIVPKQQSLFHVQKKSTWKELLLYTCSTCSPILDFQTNSSATGTLDSCQNSQVNYASWWESSKTYQWHIILGQMDSQSTLTSGWELSSDLSQTTSKEIRPNGFQQHNLHITIGPVTP